MKNLKELKALKSIIKNLSDMFCDKKIRGEYCIYTHHTRIENRKNKYYNDFMPLSSEDIQDKEDLEFITISIYMIQSLLYTNSRYIEVLEKKEKVIVNFALNKIKEFKINCKNNNISQSYFY